MFRTALLILSGNATASLLLLARNLIVARLIPVEDYGVAATFAVVMAMVEMASAFGLQQQIVQSKDGDDPRFQAALQGFQVLRGVAAGIALFLIAGPIARFLGIPEVIWAYQLLALVPVIKAFEHFDIHRLNRQMRFWPLMLTGGIPALLSLLLVWPLAAWLGDWRVMLYAILTQIAVMALTSHLVAERPYRIVFDRAIMGQSLRFGWPILANAILLFLVFQGDKIIVGRVLGMEALAIFAMGLTLTQTPILFFTHSISQFFFPQLSSSEDSEEFELLAAASYQLCLLTGTLFVFIVLLLGSPIILGLLGTKYANLPPLLVFISILSSFRLFKAGSATVSISRGMTKNALLSNIPRAILLPLSYYIAVTTGDIRHLIIIAIIGEFIGVLISLSLSVTKAGMPYRSIIVPFSGVIVIITGLLVHQIIKTSASHLPLFLITFLALAVFIPMRQLREYMNFRRFLFGEKRRGR